MSEQPVPGSPRPPKSPGRSTAGETPAAAEDGEPRGRCLPRQKVLAALLELLGIDLAAGESLFEDHERAVVADFLGDRRDHEIATNPAAAANNTNQRSGKTMPNTGPATSTFSTTVF